MNRGKPVTDRAPAPRTGPRDGVLRRRILGAFLILSLIPLFGSNAIGYARSRVIVEGLVGRYLDGMAGIQAAHIQDRLDQRLLYLSAVANGNRFLEAAAERELSGPSIPGMAEAADPPAVRVYLERKRTEASRFDVLTVHRPDGTVLASSGSDEPLPPAAVASAAGFLIVRGDDPESPPSLRFLAPVTDAQGRRQAYLSATLALVRGGEFLEIPPHVSGSIESFLLDGSGRPVFVSHPHGHVAYDRPLASPLLAAPPGGHAVYADREGVQVIGASARLPGSDWLFVAEVPVSDALAELGTLRALSLVLGSLFAALVLVAAWMMAGGIVAPLHRLVDVTRRLGRGELDVRIERPGKDEIGELGEAFNDMAGAMEADRVRIAALHRQDIERAQQLATVGELASGIAHEIKNPVVGISNGLDLVLRRTNDPALEPITSEMKRQLHRIEGAVRDLLTFARPRRPDVGPVDPVQVVQRAVSLVDPVAGRQRVRIVLRSTDRPLPLIFADADLLQQALVNLLMNALQASPSGGEVVVMSGGESRGVWITIQDQGPGIPEADLEQIFKPFFTTRHSGTGLGLPISRGIIEQHGGRLTVESGPGGGARFTVTLPLQDPPLPEETT